MAELSKKEREYQRQLDILYEKARAVLEKHTFMGPEGLHTPLRNALPKWKRDLDTLEQQIRVLIDAQRRTLHGGPWSEECGLMKRALEDPRDMTENHLGALWIVLVVRPLRPRHSETDSGDDLFYRIAMHGLSHWGRREGRSSRTVFGRTLTALTELEKLPVPFGTMTWDLD